MQLSFALFVFFFTFARSSSVENESDLLSAVDIIAFSYSQQVSQHWDCPQISDRAGMAEETRVWQMVVPDARVEEKTVASGNKALQRVEQYKWIKEGILSSGSTTAKSDLFVQSSVLLGMRKPNFDGSAMQVKMLCSRSKQVNQDALSVVLPQLEQSKDKIMDWMARSQASLSTPSMASVKATDPLDNRRFRVPQAANYHPHVFKDAHFTTGDLVALIALAAESRQKGYADVLKFFKITARSFLPSFDVKLGAVPTSSAGKPTKTVYLRRSFQYVPGGTDLAFYFDGNRGNFVRLRGDSILLCCPEGIIDGQQRAALILFSNANVDASNLEVQQTKTSITVRKAFREALEKTLALRISPNATDEEVQAIGVSTIRNLAARLEWNSSLEAQQKSLESKPTLLSELLPKKLVEIVIGYFDDNTYPITVSTHNWTLKYKPEIEIDSARLYVLTASEGLKCLSHPLANTKKDEPHLTELCSFQCSACMWFTSSHDGRYVAFSHLYDASTCHEEQATISTQWFVQGDKSEYGIFKRIMFDCEDSTYRLLSRDGQTLCSWKDWKNPITRVYRIREEAGKNLIGFVKHEVNGTVRAVSGSGNRIIVARGEWFEIYEVDKDASKLVCKIETNFGYSCALNEDGSEAAFVYCDGDELQIMDVENVAGIKADQPAIVSVKFPESVGPTRTLVYADGGKLHVLQACGKVSLFDPSTKKFILLEALQEGQEIICSAISPNADYIAFLQCADKRERNGKLIYKTTVKRKLKDTDRKNFFGHEADEEKQATTS